MFLVRYSIEEGYLSPEVRVILAALFGFALIGGAERMRSRDDRVAQALAAAGVASLYGALFAAVALYDMISKVAAGGGAAALTAFAIGVSLRHGIFVAGLAFVGGFASPAIIGSETPNTPVLFGYLLAIAAGTLAVIRLRGWWPLGWGVLLGSAMWTLLWMSSLAGGLHWVGLFLVAVAGLFVWATWRRLGESENPTDDVALLVWAALGVTGFLIVGLIFQDNGKQSAGWLALAVHGVGLYALGRWTPRFQYVAALAPILSVAALVLWWADTQGTGPDWDSEDFAWRAILLGGFFAAGAFALLWNAARPGFWAALAVAATLAHFLLCWYVLRGVAAGTPWGLISVALAVPFLVGAERLARWRETMPGATEALGYCAAGVAFFIAVAIALEFNREWITVAYAVEFAAVAAIASRLGLNAMRRLCWPLLAVVVVRFVLNPEVLKYPLGRRPDLQLDPVGLRPRDRGLRRGIALPAADRRYPAGARDRGGDRLAGLRAAHPRGAQRLSRRRHDGTRRAVHGARVLCPGVGRLRARGALAGAHAPRRRGLVGLAHQRRSGRGAGADRAGPARQPDLRAGPMSAACRSPTACSWPMPCRR